MSQGIIREILPQMIWLAGLISAQTQCIVLPAWDEPTDSFLLSLRGVMPALNGDSLALTMICYVYFMSFT